MPRTACLICYCTDNVYSYLKLHVLFVKLPVYCLQCSDSRRWSAGISYRYTAYTVQTRAGGVQGSITGILPTLFRLAPVECGNQLPVYCLQCSDSRRWSAGINYRYTVHVINATHSAEFACYLIRGENSPTKSLCVCVNIVLKPP